MRKNERLRKKAKKSSTVHHCTTFWTCRVELKSLIKWKCKQYFKGLSSTFDRELQVILGLLSIQIQCTSIKDFHLLSDIMEPMSLVLKIKLMTVPLYTKTALSVTLMLIKMFWVTSYFPQLLLWYSWNSSTFVNPVDQTVEHFICSKSVQIWSRLFWQWLFSKNVGGG